MQLKIQPCQMACRRIKMVSFLFPQSCELSVSVKENLGRRKNSRKLRFCRKVVILLKEVQKQVFTGVPVKTHRKNAHGGALFL